MCSCISLWLRCFTLELLFPVLTKRQGDVLVPTEEPIALICHQDGEWRVLKNKKHPLDSQAFAGSRSRRPGVILQPPSLVSLSVSLSLFPPPSSSRVHTSIHSPARAYMHTNMPKLSPPRRILPPFLSIIEAGPLCSAWTHTNAVLPWRRVLNTPSYLRRCNRRQRTVLLWALVSGSWEKSRGHPRRKKSVHAPFAAHPSVTNEISGEHKWLFTGSR